VIKSGIRHQRKKERFKTKQHTYILLLLPSRLWLMLEADSQEASWSIIAIKFYVSIEKAREDARPILTEKNAALVTTNLNGYSTTPGKWSKIDPATGII